MFVNLNGMRRTESSCQRAKRKACFSVSQRVQPRFKRTKCG